MTQANKSMQVVLLGTGGTIAGQAAKATDNVGYVAGQIGVADLKAAVPGLSSCALEAEQVAQIDSKDMSHEVWQRLAQRVAFHLARADVQGVVITHGTDTLEETAWFLHRVLVPAKPVVLTAAMRPATALMSDGPQNLLDAVRVAQSQEARGVLTVVAGAVWGPLDVRKLHPYRVDAFGGGDAGPVALLREGQLIRLREWPTGEPLGLATVLRPVNEWPEVAVVLSHAGAQARLVQQLVSLGVRGLVVEGTGNGTVHSELEAALGQALQAGVSVLRSTRCLAGGVVGAPLGALPSAGDLTPGKARVELLLRLLAGVR